MKAPYFQIYVFSYFLLTNPTKLSFLSCAQSLRFLANLCNLRTLLFKKIRAVSRSFCAYNNKPIKCILFYCPKTSQRDVWHRFPVIPQLRIPQACVKEKSSGVNSALHVAYSSFC